MSRFANFIHQFFTIRMLCILMLGFSSGLPLMLTSHTLQAWYTTAGLSVSSIALLALVGQAYAYKYLWSPFIDRFSLPWLDHYRGWILLCQCAIILCILSFTCLDPKQDPWLIALIACLLSFFSATQDICIDAYKINFLTAKERGLGCALNVEGYRLAMLVSGGFALIIADHMGWHMTFIMMAACMLIGVIATLIAPTVEKSTQQPKTLQEAVIKPLANFFNRQRAAVFLIFIVLYKLSDAYIGSLNTVFLLGELQLSLSEVGTINKIIGITASLTGVFLGGIILTQISLYRALFLFALLQGLSCVLFMLLSIQGNHYYLIISAVFSENLFSGMGTAALVVLLMNLCQKEYSATQYALLSSFAALGRIYLTPIGGYIVEITNWTTFYAGTAFLILPLILVLRYLKNNIYQVEAAVSVGKP